MGQKNKNNNNKTSSEPGICEQKRLVDEICQRRISRLTLAGIKGYVTDRKALLTKCNNTVSKKGLEATKKGPY